jgi:hypothetical protein
MLPAGLLACSSTSLGPSLESLTGDPIEISAMEAEIADVMDVAAVPGLSVAILNDSQVVHSRAFGVKNSKTVLAFLVRTSPWWGADCWDPTNPTKTGRDSQRSLACPLGL